jgi:4-alpha-glucanotransferase
VISDFAPSSLLRLVNDRRAALPAARAAGVQLHPTSLPEGRLGRGAYAFVDWLESAGQRHWQMLPLGPPDRAGSPYKSSSAFAASPALLAEPDAPVSAGEEADFLERHAFWAEDWRLHAGGRRAVRAQVRFEREWSALRRYAAEGGVRLIGDVPIYVAPRSVDHRAHPELFRPGIVAGAPPDAFSATGQLWGNPLYEWPALRRRRYRWWTERLRRTLELFDVARIDHFRGFVSYWAVPAGARNAAGGRWRRGPGRAVFDAAAGELGPLPFIAEDLGVITAPVTELREHLGFPGMVVLQFGCDPRDPHSTHRLERHDDHAVVYSGTHDHDTLSGWWGGLGPPARAEVERQVGRLLGPDALRTLAREPQWPLIRLTFASRARLAMLQLQDVLGLGSEGRMNLPGTARGNWRWRLRPGQLTARHARRLRAATDEAGR